MSLPLLSIKDLSVDFRQGTRVTNAVRNASLDLYKGETLALVGESGSGKSVTAHSVLRLLLFLPLIQTVKLFLMEKIYSN